MQRRIMIGVTGEFLSGKSTVAKIIKEKFPGTPSARYSDCLREFLAWVNKELSGHQVVFPSRMACLENALKDIFYPEVLQHAAMKNATEAFAFWLTQEWGGKHYFRVPEEREHLQNVSTALRRIFAENILERATAARVEKMHSPSSVLGIIEGVRRLVDIGTLLHDPMYKDKFRLLYLECDPELAFKRMKSRKENADDATMTWEKFQELRSAEAESQIKLLVPYAHGVIENSEGEEELSAKIEALVKKWISE